MSSCLCLSRARVCTALAPYPVTLVRELEAPLQRLLEPIKSRFSVIPVYSVHLHRILIAYLGPVARYPVVRVAVRPPPKLTPTKMVPVSPAQIDPSYLFDGNSVQVPNLALASLKDDSPAPYKIK